MVNMRQLEVFRAVMDSGTATAAARDLVMSQPAVSQHLAQLEEELDIDLFARERGRLKPTEQGIVLYDEIAFAFEGLERVRNLARSIRSHHTGTFRIATPNSFCDALLPKILARFCTDHPDLRYAVELGSYAEIVDMVAARKVDVGIAKEPLKHPGITTHSLTKSRPVCAMPPTHPLARCKRIALADLADEPLIMLGQFQSWRHEIDVVFRRSNIFPEIRLETHSVSAACGFVRGDIGIAIVPELLAAQYADDALVIRPLAASFRHHFVAVLPAGSRHPALSLQFIKDFRTVATQEIKRANAG
jgi:DNA-binding transcriptional LysR family regulator